MDIYVENKIRINLDKAQIFAKGKDQSKTAYFFLKHISEFIIKLIISIYGKFKN